MRPTVAESSEQPSGVAPLASGDAVDLAHALVARMAVALGVRALSIKGPSTDAYGLRRPRLAADADVLVEPSGFLAVCAELERNGWHVRHGRDTPSILPAHSRTYIRDGWPCDIDLHSWFPGMFRPASDAFDALWRGRSVLTIACSPVLVPSRSGAALIAALHTERSSRASRQRDEGRQLAHVMQTQFAPRDLREFYDLARATGAVWVLRALIAEVHCGPVVKDISTDDARRWDLNRTFNEDGSTVGWIEHWRAVRWTERPRVLLNALWVPRAEIPRNDESVIPGRAEAWRYRAARWSRGFRALRRFVGSRRA